MATVAYLDDSGTKPTKVNESSTLRRSWLTINFASCPVQLDEVGLSLKPLGLATLRKHMGGDARLHTEGKLRAQVPLGLVWIRFVAFDGFGNEIDSNDMVVLQDILPGKPFDLTGDQQRFFVPKSKTNIASLLYVISYPVKVRQLDGKLWSSDQKLVDSALTDAHWALSARGR
jgi:hypothetical protein